MTVKDKYKQEQHDKFKTWMSDAVKTLGKFEALCKPDGTFTNPDTGPVSGEFALWSLLHQGKTNGFFQTGSFGKLDKFVARMEALPGVKAVLGGGSKMGTMLDYVAPIPN